VIGRLPAAMEELRTIVNSLEGTVPRNLWPLPTYADMMFMI
jgi:glutamine synthetase type III